MDKDVNDIREGMEIDFKMIEEEKRNSKIESRNSKLSSKMILGSMKIFLIRKLQKQRQS